MTRGGDGAGIVVGKSSVAGSGEAAPKLGTTRLYIGQSYSVRATATPRISFFTNWTGTAFNSDTNTLLRFTMEPGLALQANFSSNLFVGMSGIYNGLFSNVTGVVEAPSSGLLRHFSVNKDGAYSGQLFVGGLPYVLSGSFERSGHTHKTILRAGGTLEVDLNLMFNKTPHQILGVISSSSWTADLRANLSGGAGQSGRFTALIPPAGQSQFAPQFSPAGYGYLLVGVKAGTATFTGALADGTPISQTVPVSEQGLAPIYGSLYNNTGLYWGWLDMTGNSPSGVLYWIKPASNDLFFPNGFTNNVNVIGSPWNVPQGPALPFSVNIPGILEISGGNLMGSLIFSNIVVRSDNTLINAGSLPPNTLAGSISPKTGLLKIVFGDAAAKTTAFGAVLQNSTNAGGAFLGIGNTGSITLHQ